MNSIYFILFNSTCWMGSISFMYRGSRRRWGAREHPMRRINGSIIAIIGMEFLALCAVSSTKRTTYSARMLGVQDWLIQFFNRFDYSFSITIDITTLPYPNSQKLWYLCSYFATLHKFSSWYDMERTFMALEPSISHCCSNSKSRSDVCHGNQTFGLMYVVTPVRLELIM